MARNISKARQREIASMGGKAAHAKGVAHTWTSETAAMAGRKGGLKRAENARRKAEEQEQGQSRSQ